MKLFTKEIDKQLFAQYPKGSDLENQKVIAKIFNPYGRGVWYIINSDPNDPDYLWAIVDLFDVEVGSVSRSELETLKVPPFRLGLERDMSFTPINAAELFKGALQGKRYAEGGELDIAAQNKDMLLNYAEEFEHHTKEFEKAAKNAENVMPWVIAKTERASTDLADVTHYLESENEKRREKIEGEEDDIDDFDRGGEVREFNVLYFKTITNRSGTKMDVMRDRDIISGSLEKVVSKAFDGLTPIDSYANIADRKNSSVVARIYPSGKGEVLQDGYGLNVGEIEIEQEVEEVEEKPKKKLFGLFAEGGEIEDLSDLKGRFFYIYSLGVKEPHVSIIENARITDKKYRHRDVVIESVSGGEERFPLEKLDSFLNGEQIEINDGSEIYVIQLLKDKMAEGGEIPNKKGQIVKLVNPYPDEDPNQLYEVVEQNIDEYSNPEDKILISALNTDMEIPPTFRVEKKELVVVSDKMAEGGMMSNGGSTSSPNMKFMKWYVDWLKSVNKYIYVSISIPNEFSSPIKDGNDEIVILDIIEKKGDTDVKKYMNEIVEKADEFGVSIYLQPIPRTHNLKSQEHKDKITKDYLIKYYEKFGFKNMDSGFMVREPKMASGGKIKVGKTIMYQGKKAKVISKKGDMYFVEIENYHPNGDSLHTVIRESEVDKMASGGMMAEGGGINGEVNYLIEVNNEKISSRKKGSANYFDRGSGKEVVTYSLIEFKGDVKNPESKKRLLGITNHKLRLLKDKGGKLGVGAVGALNFFKKYGYDLNVEPKLLKADEKLDVKKVGENVYVEKMISTSLLSEFYDIYEPAYIDPEVKERYEKSKESNKMAEGGELSNKTNTLKLIEQLEKHSDVKRGTESVSKVDGLKYRWDKYVLKYDNAANYLVNLFEKAAAENSTRYATQFHYGDDYTFYYDRPKFTGAPNGKIIMSKLVILDNEKMAKGGVVEKKYFMTISFDQKQRSGGYGINRVSVSVRAKNQTEAISKAKKLIREGYRGDMPIKNVEVIYPSIKVEDITYEKGGKITFDDKVSAIKKSLLERKKVSPSVQKDYGKTYSPKEAEESAKRIVGAMTAKERLMKKRKK